MYIPKHFQVHEEADLISYIQSNSLGISLREKGCPTAEFNLHLGQP
jgi:predicted FMN-binding regulatory protein PaiB